MQRKGLSNMSVIFEIITELVIESIFVPIVEGLSTKGRALLRLMRRKCNNLLRNPKAITGFLLLLTLTVTTLYPGQIMAQGKKRGKIHPNNEAIKPTLPYSVVIDPTSKKRQEVILAVNTVTTVRCPETPGNLAIGNDIGLDQDKFKNGGHGFFLRPTQAGLSTNIVVDFNGKWTAEFYITVVNVKDGARPGDFTGEVIIQKPGYQTALESAETELDKTREEATKLQGRVTALEQELKQQAQIKIDRDHLEILKLVETYAQGSYRQYPTIDLAGGRARVRQLDRAQRTEQGWIVVYEIENRAKEQLSLSDVKTDQYRVLTTSVNRQISPKVKARVAFLIEYPTSNGTVGIEDTKDSSPAQTPKQLNVSISGDSATLKIEG